MSTSKNILLVEDEVRIAIDMEGTLTKLGHHLILATTTVEAMQAASHSIDVTVLDFHLKAGDTSVLAQHLHARGIPFVVCSGTACIEELGAAFSPRASYRSRFPTMAWSQPSSLPARRATD